MDRDFDTLCQPLMELRGSTGRGGAGALLSSSLMRAMLRGGGESGILLLDVGEEW